MSILIKNMKMPTSCIECPLETDYGTCGYFLPTKDNETNYQKRPDFCPLIEVPPHGRLVDADKLLKAEYNIDLFGYSYIRRREICNAPTIIEAEESES